MPPASRRYRSLLRALTVMAVTVIPCGIAHADVLFDWTPDSDHVTGRELKALTGPAGTLAEDPVFDDDELLKLGGKQHLVFPEEAANKIPSTAFSIEAEVRIDQAQRWGSVIAHSQDNGSYERGWLLGHNNSRFVFKISTGGSLIQAESNTDFQPGEWAHLVGVFDGNSARLYVDGKPAANLPLSGELARPDIPTPFVLGAYKDNDEYYPLLGRIRRARIHDGALTAAEIAESGPESFPFVVHPALRFLGPGRAELTWDSATPGRSLVAIGPTKKLGRKIISKTEGHHHRAVLDQLLPNTTYHYQVTTRTARGTATSEIHSFETSLNEIPPDLSGTIPPATDKRLREHAAKAVAAAGFERGFCLVLGLTDGTMLREIARISGLTVVGVESDPERVSTIRTALHAQGLYGRRISITAIDDLAAPPFTSCLANLIVSERTLAGEPLATPPAEINRLLRPGGLAMIARENGDPGLQKSRPPLDGAGEWSHQYADPANTANADDLLGGVNLTGDFSVQWIGRPGGDFGLDRNPRMPAPLAINGRLFHQGMNRMIALDAYNGRPLWALEIPDLRRVNIPHDCSNWCADDDTIYVAIRDRAWMIDAATGERTGTFELTTAERPDHDWGFIACNKSMLFGSSTVAGAQFTNFWGKAMWFDKAGQPTATTVVCSDRLFTYDKHSKKGLWAYRRGLIVNSTITIAGDRMWFVESLPSKEQRPADGRFFNNSLWLAARAVCLDTNTGKILWDKPIPNPDIEVPVPKPPPPPEPTPSESASVPSVPSVPPDPTPPEPTPDPPEPKTQLIPLLAPDRGYIQVAYGSHTSQGFLLLRSIGGNVTGGLYSYLLFDGETGEFKWHQTTKWRTGDHGSHMSHPVVMDDRVYVEPTGVSLADGSPLDHKFGPRSGCATVSGARNNLFFRGIDRCLTQWSLDSRTPSAWSRLRTSCWLNMLPAQGMLLVPEGGGGCSCGGWLETSLGFLPNSLQRQP